MDSTEEPIQFLSLADVEMIHADELETFGGAAGYVDRNVVEMAVASPQAAMFGKYLNEDIAGMAAAYLFAFARSQGFRDGNKRTAAVCATTFLNINGYDLQTDSEGLYGLTTAVAKGTVSKDTAADWIRSRIAPVPHE